MSCPNLPALFLDRAGRYAERPFLWSRGASGWQTRSWSDARREVTALADGLSGLGLEPGSRVAVVAENRPEWLLAEIAVLAAGGITVPAYVTNTVEDHRHVLSNSGAIGAMVSTRRLCRRIRQAAPEGMRFILCMEDSPEEEKERTGPDPDAPDDRPPHPDGPMVRGWAEVVTKSSAERGEALLRHNADRLRRDAIACILHTSGTGGRPRGVTLTHGAILSNLHGAGQLLKQLTEGEEVFLSVLPISHAYEHTAGQWFPLSIGAQIHYLESLTVLSTALREVRPTVMVAVPRLFETIHQRMLRDTARLHPMRRQLLRSAVRSGTRALASSPRALGERVLHAVLDAVVLRQVRMQFGGRFKAIVSGGAPLGTEVECFFRALGLPVLQGYGLTEASPVVSCNPPARPRPGTVGPPLDRVDVRLADDGEILVRGELLMSGYWNDPDATREVLRDGWLYTGDIGRLDVDGYLIITDRKKDIIKDSGGEMISPQKVEGVLTAQPEIAQALVFGDRRPHLVALVVPDPDLLRAWARRGGENTSRIIVDPEFRRLVSSAVDRANHCLSPAERVRRFLLLPDPFSIEAGTLTPTLKLRRRQIIELHGPALEGLYDVPADHLPGPGETHL